MKRKSNIGNKLVKVSILVSNCLFLIQLVSAEAKIHVVPEIANVNVGQRFTVDIDVDNVMEPYPLYGLQLSLEYNPEVISFIGIILEGDLLSGDGTPTFMVNPVDSVPGKLDNFALVRYEENVRGVSGSGMLAKIEFMAESAGSSPITIVNSELDSFLGSTVIAMSQRVENGNVNVFGDGSLGCTIDLSAWDRTFAIEGETVNMNMRGQNCNGELINITIMEYDGGAFGSDDIVQRIENVQFSTSRSWEAIFVDDVFGAPEYYFVVESGGRSYSSGVESTKLLRVRPSERVTETRTINFIRGKNTFSMPLLVANMSIQNVFLSIANKADRIYTYDGEWKIYYFDGQRPSNLVNLEIGRGYVVYMKESAALPITLTITGTKRDADFNVPSLRLREGWQLIGTFSVRSAVSNFLRNVLFREFYRFNENAVDYERIINSADLLEEDEGYWIYADRNATILPIIGDVVND